MHTRCTHRETHSRTQRHTKSGNAEGTHAGTQRETHSNLVLMSILGWALAHPAWEWRPKAEMLKATPHVAQTTQAACEERRSCGTDRKPICWGWIGYGGKEWGEKGERVREGGEKRERERARDS